MVADFLLPEYNCHDIIRFRTTVYEGGTSQLLILKKGGDRMEMFTFSDLLLFATFLLALLTYIDRDNKRK